MYRKGRKNKNPLPSETASGVPVTGVGDLVEKPAKEHLVHGKKAATASLVAGAGSLLSVGVSQATQVDPLETFLGHHAEAVASGASATTAILVAVAATFSGVYWRRSADNSFAPAEETDEQIAILEENLLLSLAELTEEREEIEKLRGQMDEEHEAVVKLRKELETLRDGLQADRAKFQEDHAALQALAKQLEGLRTEQEKEREELEVLRRGVGNLEELRVVARAGEDSSWVNRFSREKGTDTSHISPTSKAV